MRSQTQAVAGTSPQQVLASLRAAAAAGDVQANTFLPLILAWCRDQHQAT